MEKGRERMRKIGYCLGVIFISFSVFFWLPLNATVQEIEAREFEQTMPEAKSDEVISENTCQKNLEIDSAKIERWWILECDNTIKAWDVEAEVCDKRRDGEAQADCKARVNQKYYSLLKDLVKRRELKVQKIEEIYNECQAKKGPVGTEEDIKK